MKVEISNSILKQILRLARLNHPKEVVLLLRGQIQKRLILVEDFLFPPLAVSGFGFAEFPVHLLPIDFSIMGTAHSHPSGFQIPSVSDLNHFYSRIMMILPYPYHNKK